MIKCLTLLFIFLSMAGCQFGKNEPLRVGTTGDYTPFSYWDVKQRKFLGIDIELAHSLGEHLGREVIFVNTSWPTLMDDFKANKFDIAISGISILAERQKHAYFSRPYFFGGKTGVLRCSDMKKWGSIVDIDRPDVKVIYNPGGTNEQFAKKWIRKGSHVLHQDNRTIFDALLNKKADIFFTDYAEARFVTRKRTGLCLFESGKLYTKSNLGIMLKKDKEFKKEIDEWLSVLVKKRELEKLYNQFEL
jgi:cyclohexadienyl dehydratase